MEEEKALIQIQNTSVTLNRINNIVETTNKLLKIDFKELIEWWEGLDEIWQLLFYNVINFDKSFPLNFDFAYSKFDEERKNNGAWLNSDSYRARIKYIKEIKRKLKEPSLMVLVKIVKLEEIIINGSHYGKFTNLKSFKPLEKLEKLKLLQIERLPKTDLSSLPNLSSLIELRIYEDNDVKDLKSISSLKNLEKLKIIQNLVEDLTPLSDLVKLNHLELGGNKITIITPLTSLVKLTKLSLSNNKIKDITPLTSLINLKELNLYGNNISDGESIKYLTNLEILDLRTNKITNIENFIYHFKYFGRFEFDNIILQQKYTDYNINAYFQNKLYLQNFNQTGNYLVEW